MELNKVMESRRSIRKYKDQDVSHDDLVTLIQAAQLAPSWKNSQVSRYYVVEDKDMLTKVKEALPEFNQNNVKNAPVLIVSTIELNHSGFDNEGNPSTEIDNGWGYYDCGLQHMNLLLKANELGLGTLVMGIRDHQVLRNVLHIPDNESVVSVISVGYPDIEPAMPKRKDIKEITKFFL